jgi:hypothetical protein
VFGIELQILMMMQKFANAFTFVEEGAARADTAWVVTTNDAIIVGGASGTAIVWMQFASSVTVTLENIREFVCGKEELEQLFLLLVAY